MTGATMQLESGTGDTGVAEATPASRAAPRRREMPQDLASEAAARSSASAATGEHAFGRDARPEDAGWLRLPHQDPRGSGAALWWRRNPARSVVIRLNRHSRTRLSAFIVRIIRTAAGIFPAIGLACIFR